MNGISMKNKKEQEGCSDCSENANNGSSTGTDSCTASPSANCTWWCCSSYFKDFPQQHEKEQHIFPMLSPVPYERIYFEEDAEGGQEKNKTKEFGTMHQQEQCGHQACCHHHDAKKPHGKKCCYQYPTSYSASSHHSQNSTNENEVPVENFYFSRDIIHDTSTKFSSLGTAHHQPDGEGAGLSRLQEERGGGAVYYRRSVSNIRSTFVSKEAAQIHSHQISMLSKQTRGGQATIDEDKNSFAHSSMSSTSIRTNTSTLGTKKKKSQKQDLSATMNFPYKKQYATMNVASSSSSPRRTAVLWKEGEEQDRLEKHFNVDWQMKFLRSFYSKKEQTREEQGNHDDKVNEDQNEMIREEEEYQEIENDSHVANESSASTLENKGQNNNDEEDEDEVEIIAINLPNNHNTLQEYELMTKKRLVACIDQTDLSRYQLQEFEMKINFPRDFYLRQFLVERQQRAKKKKNTRKWRKRKVQP